MTCCGRDSELRKHVALIAAAEAPADAGAMTRAAEAAVVRAWRSPPALATRITSATNLSHACIESALEPVLSYGATKQVAATPFTARMTAFAAEMQATVASLRTQKKALDTALDDMAGPSAALPLHAC